MGGIYFHIPFCIRKCSYCDFYSETDQSLIEKYIEYLKKEISMYKSESIFDTIYFGGGTPSLLKPENIELIIDGLSKNFEISSNSEITLETNPGSVDPKKLDGFKKAGINRLNIGIQSFDDGKLKFLGRIHSSDQAVKVFEDARNAGFTNIGIDIIYGLPNQNKEDLKRDLKKALELDPDHISAYTLTYEENTGLSNRLKKGEFKALEEGKVSDLFLFVSDFLTDKGYEHYEISNFAKPEMASKHNTKYWNYEEYFGFGPSAHSYSDLKRWWNVLTIKEYFDSIKNGEKPILESEDLDQEQQMIEAVYLGLRQKNGILISEFEKRFNLKFNEIFPDLDRFTKEKFMTLSGERCALTVKGMTMHDYIVSSMIRDL